MCKGPFLAKLEPSRHSFVFEIDGNIIPVEVKSGFNTKAKSLQAFINKYNPRYSIKFTGNKFGFTSDTTLRRIIGQEKIGFDFVEIMNQGKILFA